jgi:hypothetical protein
MVTHFGPFSCPYSPKCLEAEFSEVRMQDLAYGPRRPRACPTSRDVWALVPTFTLYIKRPRMKAPATSSTRSTTTKIKPIGSKTTSAALPVVVECISRIPTTARYNP